MNSPTNGAVSPPAVLGEAQQTIPFRPEGEPLATHAMSVLGVLVLLLAACLLAAWYARKRGWLDRWVSGTRLTRAPGQKPMQVQHSLRVSPRTTVYRISDEGRSYLLVESSVNARMRALDAVDAADA